MTNKNIIIITSIVAIILFIFFAKGFDSKSQTITGIDKSSDYNLAMADAKAKGEPVFLEFFGNT